MPKSSFPSNLKIAEMLREIAAAYEAKGGNRFKIHAYDRAATAIEHASSAVKDIWDEGKLEEIPGIGKGIAAHLDEYFQTGDVVHFEKVKSGLPEGMFELLRIPGVGPKSAYELASKLKVDGISQLKKASSAGKVRELPGWGEKSEQEILAGIGELERRSDRMLLSEAQLLANRVREGLAKVSGIRRIDALGSLRRQVATIGDVDLAVVADDPVQVIEAFVKLPGVTKVISSGEVKASVLMGHRQVDLYIQPQASYGSLLQHFTGSKHHNIALRTRALDRGMSLSEHGIKKEGKLHQFANEESFYQFLGMDWIPPELREDGGEIEAALKHKLPELIELKDIKGDLHVHSNWPSSSPLGYGVDSPEEMFRWAKDQGYAYLGLADHAPRATSQPLRSIKKELAERKKLYAAASKRVGLKILYGLEVDIFADGSLCLPDEVLAELDYVIASIHTAHRQSKEVITTRLLQAIDHPQVKIVGHPTGRLLNQREGYEVDWEQVFSACREHGVALEVNASPVRLDLSETLVREAVAAGVGIAIGSDAHAVDQMDYLRYGVAVARRGWAEKGNIINTRGVKEVFE